MVLTFKNYYVGINPRVCCSSVDGYIDEEIERIKVVAGLELAHLPSIGVYHYRQTDCGTPHNSTCSVIANHHTKANNVLLYLTT